MRWLLLAKGVAYKSMGAVFIRRSGQLPWHPLAGVSWPCSNFALVWLDIHLNSGRASCICVHLERNTRSSAALLYRVLHQGRFESGTAVVPPLCYSQYESKRIAPHPVFNISVTAKIVRFPSLSSEGLQDQLGGMIRIRRVHGLNVQ